MRGWPTKRGPGRSGVRRVSTLRRWIDRLRDLRVRVLANPRFQRFAARFPLTRPVALARSRRLFDLSAGFVYSRILRALVELDVVGRLRREPATAEQLAVSLDLPPDSVVRLLRAGRTLDLLEVDGRGVWRPGALGAPLLDQPALTALIAHNDLLYRELEAPVELLARGRGRELPEYWPYSTTARRRELSDDRVAPYSALMSASAPLVAAEVVDAYDFRKHRSLLDVGGGEGVFLEAVAAEAPHLRLHLFDLPAVTARARRRLEGAGISDRVSTHGGDFLEDPLPEGADVVTLVRILHDHDDESAAAILAAVHRALPAGGTLVVAEPMSGLPHADPVGEAYFSFYLLALGQGRARTPDELAALTRDAGFDRIRLRRPATPVVAGVLVARR